MFGEGQHPHMRAVYERDLAPWLSETANAFWGSRLWYFRSGLYYQGGMVRLGCCTPQKASNPGLLLHTTAGSTDIVVACSATHFVFLL